MRPLTTAGMRRVSGVSAATIGAAITAMPLAAGHPSPTVTTLALAGAIALIVALTIKHVVLPGAILLYASELLIAHHDHSIPTWTIPPFAALLILLHDIADLRHTLPPDASIESRAIQLTVRRLALAATLATSAAALVLAASNISSRGPASAIAGSLAITTLLALTALLARNQTSSR